MANFILIKHASPEQDSAAPSHQWRLSAAGREKAAALVEPLRRYAPRTIVTSDEPKAIETGEIVAMELGVTVQVAPDLHEHDRSDVPMLRTGEFISAMAQFFRERDRLVLGSETAQESLDRFQRALETVKQQHAGENIAVVSHGTVLALYAALLTGTDAFLLWRRMKLPSYLVVDDAHRTVIELVEQI